MKKNIIVRYDSYPSKAILKEEFEITLQATIATDSFDHILTTFIGGKGYEVLNNDSKWLWKNNRFFTNRFIFKVSDSDFEMPNIIISLVKDEEIVEEFILSSLDISVSKIGQQIDSFTSVVAQDFQIKSHLTRQYDNNSLLTLIEIEAKKSNLEDFYLKGYTKQGLESIKGDFDKKVLVYYVIIPLHLDNLTLSYYNTKTSKIEIISSPIVHSKDIVSTQTDLNPNNSDLLLYKKIAVAVVILFLVVLILFYRTKSLFLLLIISLGVMAYLFMPNSKILIDKDTNIFILPTKSSSVFYKTDKEIEVEVLYKHRGYIKVLLPDSNIGWIDEEDLAKN